MRHLKPREIQGCQLALDASIATSLYDATSGGSLVAADGAVARWEDQSGNARHATQGTLANRPLRKSAIQGGLDSIRFDGTNDQLVHGATSGSDPNTLFACVKWLNGPDIGYKGIVSYGNAGTDSGAMLLMRTTSQNKVGTYGASDLHSTYVAPATAFTVAQSESGGSVAWQVNAKSAGSASDATGSLSQSVAHVGGFLGIGTNDQSVNAEFFNVTVYNVALSDYIQARLSAATMRKWRING